jgi:Flp pilus assembly pilin Flp
VDDMTQFLAALLGLYTRPDQRLNEREGAVMGQGLVEYALILAFIAIAVIVSLVFFGDRLTTLYSKLGSSIPT